MSVDAPLAEGTGGMLSDTMGAGMNDISTGGVDIAQDPMTETGGDAGPKGGAVTVDTGGEQEASATGGDQVAMATGGAAPSGGTTATGGDVMTGGVTSSGGIMSTGGVASTGGVPTGGATGGSTSTRDPNGPCKDLNLFCFDPFDMFIFNPDCFTCNNGKGCQACVGFQAQ